MKYLDVLSKIGHLPATDNEKCHILFNFIVEKKLTNVLEIGFFHGKSSNFIAAALDELGGGRVLTIDLKDARSYKPNIVEVSALTGLSKLIEPIFSPLGSQWEMRRLIMESTRDGVCTPEFDLCFIDAYHSWERAGLDFFLAEKLLKPGGWMILDDLYWSFDQSPTWKNRPETLAMPEEYRKAQQVGEVYELLVRQHPSFDSFHVVRDWGFARKRPRN